MNFYTFSTILVLSSALLLTFGGAEFVSDPPDKCVAKKLGPDYAIDKLAIDEAICMGDWMFGINFYGVFGLWNDDDLVQDYIREAQRLRVHAKSRGEEVFVSVYQKGEPNPIWELACEGLSGKQKTKLNIKGEKPFVVKFKQGSSPQNRLWLVEKNGDNRLDDAFCKITKEPPMKEEPRYNLVVNEKNRKYCIGLDDANGLILDECDSSNDNQLWSRDYTGLNLWHPKKGDHLCVNVRTIDDGQSLHIKHCKNARYEEWIRKPGRARTITPKEDFGLCVTGRDFLIEKDVELVLQSCTGKPVQRWEFVNPQSYAYVSPNFYFKLIVLRENRDFCIAIGQAQVGISLKLAKCNRTQNNQLWAFDSRDSRGRWHNKNDLSLCVDSDRSYVTEGVRRELFLEDCGNTMVDNWGLGPEGDVQITPDPPDVYSPDICVSYDNTRGEYQNAHILLETCGSSGQMWKFYDPRDYHSRDGCVEQCYKEFLSLYVECLTTDDMDEFMDKYGLPSWRGCDENGAYNWVADCKKTKCNMQHEFLKSQLEEECLFIGLGYHRYIVCEEDSEGDCEKNAMDELWNCLAVRRVGEV